MNSNSTNGANKEQFVPPRGNNGDNLNDVNEVSPKVSTEFVNGTNEDNKKYEDNKLNSRATNVLLEQPENKAQKDQQSESILDIVRQNFQEIMEGSNRNEKETKKDGIRWENEILDAVQGQNDDTNSAGGVRLRVSQLNLGKWKFEYGNSDHMPEGHIFLDNDGNVTNLGYSTKFMNFIKARYSDTNFRNNVLNIDPAIAIFDGSIDDIYDKEMCTFLDKKPIPLGLSNKSRSYTGLAKKVSDDGYPNQMKHLVAIRNFFFKIAMWIAAKCRGDGNMNFSVRSDARGVCEDLDLNLGSGAYVRINDATLIPTCRDGNCTLWATLKAVYGEEFVENNFEYCRNTLIPYFRSLLGQYGGNCGFRASYIEPKLLGPVAQALGCDIAVITGNGQGISLLTKDDNFIECNNFTEEDKKRFIAALQNGRAIYGSNGHMWGLNTGGGVQYVYPASQSFNTTKQSGTGNDNSPNTGNPGLEPGDIPDGFEVISNDPPNDEGQL